MGPDEARATAYDVVRASRVDDAYVNLLLPRLLRDRDLGGRDAAFATELTHGTLRRRGTYDAIIAAAAGRPLDSIDPDVLDVLRLGTHQLVAMRVPSHAAVSTSVNLVRAVVGHRATGFVNGVLRAVGRHDLDGWLQQVLPASAADTGVARLAVEHSHPTWVVEALDEAVTATGDGDLPGLLAADNEAPRVTLVARPGLSDRDELVRAGAEAGRWSPYAAHLPAGDPGAIAAVRQGRAGVQDEASQLVTLALADAPLEGDDVRWLDLCAGPGGKAALLAGLAAERGARLIANELHPHRATLVRQSLQRYERAKVVVSDGTDERWHDGGVDRVLLDAPCTGLGALRRRPEARWRRVAADVPDLVDLQRRLLDSALRAVRVGGLVAYVTCSPHLAETDEVVAAALAGDLGPRRATFEQVDVRTAVPHLVDDLPGLSGPALRTWPHVHGTDAMYLALLRRT